jgi:hypothetical protein
MHRSRGRRLSIADEHASREHHACQQLFHGASLLRDARDATARVRKKQLSHHSF